MKKFNFPNGFTLVEAAIALGILATLILTGVTVQKLLDDSTKVGERTQAAFALSTTLRERLKYSNLCGESLGVGSGLNRNLNINQLLRERQQIELKIPGIKAGPDGTEDILRAGQVLFSRRLRVDDLKFINVTNVTGNTFVGQLRIGVTTFENLPLKPLVTGTIQFDMSGNSGTQDLLTCGGINSDVSQKICEDMGCEWQSSPLPTCICKTISSLCPLGQYPIEFQPDGPVCLPLGGTCPVGEYLVSVGIGSQTCAPLPAAPGPAPAPAPGPAPAPSPALISGAAACNNIGQPCDTTQQVQESPSTFIVDLCGCTNQFNKSTLYNSLTPFYLNGGDHSTSGQYDYTVTCRSGVITATEMGCWLFAGSCNCR